ncbi:MAG: hypothetical protein ABR543_05420 [Gemmatimonadaceae bacterium]
MARSLFRVTTFIAAFVLGCAPPPSTQTDSGTPAPAPGQPTTPERVNSTWPIKTRAHVDLWLHGFAMLQDDTTQVPYFRRGYRNQMVTLRNRANVITQLETNRDRLRARFAINRDLIGAQFLALYFGSWESMEGGIQLFLDAEGDPRRASNQTAQQIIATFGATFPSPADRDWLRLFFLSLREENDKFYRTYWLQQQRDRAPVVTRLDSLWETIHRPKLQRYLNNTQIEAGTFLLSLPLDGEGRTITGGRETNTIAVSFPETPAAAVEAIYVFAHEAIIPVSSVAVSDNVTPTEQRAGLGDRYTANAAVLGGAMLLKRVAPELLSGYSSYYLRAANAPSAVADPMAALERAFPLPDTIRSAIDRQLEIVLGGI